MARLTKARQATLHAERQAFVRISILVRAQGYSLHRMMGLQPYGVLTVDQRLVFQETLADIETWVDAQREPK